MYFKWGLLVGALLVTLAALLLALCAGSYALSLAQVAQGFLQPDSDAGHIIWQLRLPRALAAAVCGTLLALSGCLMQILLRNPLADPAILGVSGGASLAALSAISLGVSASALPGLAFGGALVAMCLVLLLANVAQEWNNQRLLLTGVVLSAGFGAGISFLLTLSPDQRVYSMLFWLMGDLSDANLPGPAALVALAILLVAMGFGRSLDLLVRGELAASSLGVAVAPVRSLLFVLASLSCATAVSLGGNLGFVGLVVPHMLRLAGVQDHRWLLPLCALFGAALLVVADTGARLLFAPTQLPVGVVLALCGVPLFLWLLQRQARSGGGL
jgi:iron complex transport system permease protein